MKVIQIISFATTIIIPGILYTYYYPWLYNKINSYTNRSQFLDDEIDLLNSILVFFFTWLVFVFISIMFMPLLIPILIKSLKKYK